MLQAKKSSKAFSKFTKALSDGRRSLVEKLEERRLLAAVARINVGGPAYTDTLGQVWQADANFAGGTVESDSSAVGNTSDPAIYQTRRAGSQFDYAIPVPNGTYALRLSLIETQATAAGQRVQTVFAENGVAFYSLDTFAFAGFRNAFEIQNAVTVTDGTLNLRVTPNTGTPSLAGIQVFTLATAVIDKTNLYFNKPIGTGATTAQTVNLRNDGPERLGITSVRFVGGDAGLFAVAGATSGGLLTAGQNTNYSVTFSPPAGTTAGVKSTTLRFTTDDPVRPVVDVTVRAIATTGEGGTNEPSLQRIFDLYNLPIRTGDPNPATAQLFNNTSPIGANDEIAAQTFAKAAAGPVTIEPLAVFGVASQPAAYLNWYVGFDIEQSHQLYRIPTRSAQTVNVEGKGSLSFDPDGTQFGFSTNWPGFADGSNLLTSKQRTVYQSDVYNTVERTVANRDKVRIYQLRNANGFAVPNAYVVAFEEFANDLSGSYDNQDLVFIVRNVRPITEARLTLTNQDGAGALNSQLVFNNIVNKGTNVTKTSSTLRLNNTSSVPLTVTGLGTTAGFTMANNPPQPFEIPAGGFFDLVVNFTATTPGDISGSLFIISTDAQRPSQSVNLRGKLTQIPEGGEEPSFRKIVNDIYGYRTSVGGQDQFNAAAGANTKIGDEVLSELWQQADPGKRIYVRQIAAYHTQARVAQFYVFPSSDPTSINTTVQPIFTITKTDAQTLLPRTAASGNPVAQAYFDMGVDTTFGFATRDGSGSAPAYYSINSLNDSPTQQDMHLYRFYPAKDQYGVIIPDTYIVGVDYNGVNYDYQDDVYVISNIRPAGAPAAVRGIGLSQVGNTVNLTWANSLEANVNGYNVFRSLSPGSGLVKINTSNITSTFFTDTTAPIGARVYYYVSALTTTGKSSVVSIETILTT